MSASSRRRSPSPRSSPSRASARSALSGAGRLYVADRRRRRPAPLRTRWRRRTPAAASCSTTAEQPQNPAFVAYPQGGLSASNTLRVGDTLSALSGIVDFRFSVYRVQPTAPVELHPHEPAAAAPDDVGGNLRIASFNVLNYFNGDGAGGGFPTSRGANTPFEFQRQRAKEVSALTAMNADIVGLMEMENDAARTARSPTSSPGLNDRARRRARTLHRHRCARHRRDQGRADLQAGVGHAGRRLEGADGGAGSALRHDARTGRRSPRRSRTTRTGRS